MLEGEKDDRADGESIENIKKDIKNGYSFWDDVIGELRTWPVIDTTRVRLEELRLKDAEPNEKVWQVADVASVIEFLKEIRTDPKHQKARELIGTARKKSDSSPMPLLDRAEENPNDAENIFALANVLAGQGHIKEAKALLTIQQEFADRPVSPRLRFQGHPETVSLLARIAERESDWETIVYLLTREKNPRRNKNPNDARMLVYAFNRLNRQEEAIWAIDSSTEKTYLLQNSALVENYMVGMKGAGVNFEKRFREIIEELLRNKEKEKQILKVIASIFKALNEQSCPWIVLSIAEKFGNEYTFRTDHDITIQRAIAHIKLRECEKVISLLALPDGKESRFDTKKAKELLDYATKKVRRPT